MLPYCVFWAAMLSPCSYGDRSFLRQNGTCRNHRCAQCSSASCVCVLLQFAVYLSEIVEYSLLFCLHSLVSYCSPMRWIQLANSCRWRAESCVSLSWNTVQPGVMLGQTHTQVSYLPPSMLTHGHCVQLLE